MRRRPWILAVCIALAMPFAASRSSAEDAVKPGSLGSPDSTDALESAVVSIIPAVIDRRTIAAPEGRWDRWLLSRRGLDEIGERLRVAYTRKQKLPMGWRLDEWAWMDVYEAYQITFDGPRRVYGRVSRDRDGTLVELFDVGVAPRTVVPTRYRARLLTLPHNVFP